MPDYFYDMDLVVDPLNTANVVANGMVSIYDPADTAGTTLLALKDPSGLPLPNPLTSNANGFLPPRIAQVPQTMWKAGSFTGYFNSYKGLRDEAVAAKAASEGAATSAAVVAQQALATAAVNPSGNLILTKANGSTQDAGRVIGPIGPQGPGGTNGTNGTNGVNGANVLPTQEAIEQAIINSGPAKAALDANYIPGLVITGVGIDPTGTADSTAGIQAKLDSAGVFGADAYLPYGTYKMSSKVTISKKLRLNGPGILNFVSGITNTPCLEITAAGTVVEGITLLNPNYLASSTGNKNSGISITAKDVRIANTHIEGMQSGIVVQPVGEYSNTIIIGNRIKDVNGAGGGRDNANTYGEDRGDGILTWGCQATVTGNVVNARPGTDARVGIHAEALGGANALGAEHPDAMVTFTGNVVYGPFRRGMVFEGISYGSMVGNVIADSTWWAFALIFGRACTATGNAVNWTATAADNQGSAWNPSRGPIMVLGECEGHVVADNTVEVNGNAPAGIIAKREGVGRPNDVTIDGNTVKTRGAGTMGKGVLLDSAGVARVTNNTVKGYTTQGVGTWDSADYTIDNNSLTGVAAFGVKLDGAGRGGSVSGNKIRSATTAISAVSQVDPMKINNNDIKDATTGIDLWGTASPTVVVGNVFKTVTTKIANAGGSVVAAGNTP